MAILDLSNSAPDHFSFDQLFNIHGKYKAHSATSVTVTGKDGVFQATARAGLEFIWFDNPVLGLQALAGGMETMTMKSTGGKVLATITEAVGYLPAYDGLMKTDPKDAGKIFASAVFAFNDTILGSKHDDLLSGFSGNDRLSGGKGADRLDGGTEIDTVFYSSAVTVDMQDAAKGKGEAAGDTFRHVEIVEGSAKNDTLLGNKGDNTLRGMDGDDKLDGRGGNDVIEGGAGDDTLTGGPGINTLDGGPGVDKLTGHNAGTDTFIFRDVGESGVTSAAADSIFKLGAGDRIDVSAIDAMVANGGNDAFVYTAGGALTGAGQVVSEMDGKDTILKFSTDADADAEMVIRLVGFDYHVKDLSLFLTA